MIDRLPQLGSRAAYAKQAIRDKLIEHQQYICKHGDDMPEITGWRGGGRGRVVPGARRPKGTMSRRVKVRRKPSRKKSRQSTGAAHLWAIGYEDMDRAGSVKDEIIRLGWDESYLDLSDVAVVVRHPDGSFTVNREPFPAVANVLGVTTVGFIAGLVLGAPLACAAVGALLGAAVGAGVQASVGIADGFVCEVEGMMRPGTSALFVLDHEGNMDVILHQIRGLGGTVLKTNVDVERAKLIQATLAGAPEGGTPA